MKKILTILFVFVAFFAKAQYTPMNAYGYLYKRIIQDSTAHIPSFCGVPTLRNSTATKKSAIAIDTCNHRLYFYDAKTLAWDYVGGSSGATVSNFTTNTAGDTAILTLSDATVYKIRIGSSISTINIITDSSISICNFNSCDTFITTVTANLVTILNDSTLQVCDYSANCDTLNIPRTQFAVTLFDTSNIYNYINNIYNYLTGDTAYLNQFQPRGVYVHSWDLIQDSIARVCYFLPADLSDSCVDKVIPAANRTYLINLFDSLATIRDSLQRDTTIIDAQTADGIKIAYATIDSNSTTHDTLHVRINAEGKTGKVLSNDGTNLLWVNQAGAIQNGIVSGGRVTWLHDYVYNISPAVYYIDGIQYSSASTDITLAAADPTDDRIDIFNLTTSNTAIAVTGTAGSGIPPDYDASLQLNISFALVSANTTAPVGVVQQWIYQENGPWTPAASTGAINVASTNNPYAGSLDVEGTNVTNAVYVTFSAPTVPNMALYDALTFQIRSKGNFASNKKLVFRWFVAPSNATGNNVPIGSGSYGFISTVTASYQTITIPLSDFGNITGANRLRITQSNTSGNAGWYLDNIQLQKTTGSTTQDIYDLVKNATGDSFYFKKNGDIVRRLKDSAGTSGTGSTNLNIGAGFRAAVPGTNNIKTSFNGYAIGIDSASNTNGLTFKLDTALALTKLMAASLYQPIGSYLTNITGLVTAGTNVTVTGSGTSGSPYVVNSSGSSVTPAALTKTDDANVTLTLGGTPTTALLQATSLTLGWTGSLVGTRGGTGQTTTTTGDLLVGGAANIWNKLAAGTSGYVLTSGGAGVAPSWVAGGAGTITGSGIFGRITYWDGASSITSDTAFRAQPLGTLTSTKTYSGVAIKPGPKAVNNTDTLVGLEITNKWDANGKTGVIHQALKINKMFFDMDSLLNITMGVGDAARPTTAPSVFIGYKAGTGATDAYLSNFMGYQAGNGAAGSSACNFFGYLAGNGVGVSNANFLGQEAGNGATNASTSNFLGAQAGKSATNANNSNFLGSSAGNSATGANNSNFLGNGAGSGATNANNSNFLGAGAGNASTGANNSNFIGSQAGHTATSALQSNFMGYQAGRLATNASQSNFFGYETGLAATGASYSNFLGYHVGDSLTHKITGSNNIIIGTNITTPTAGTANTFNFGNVLYGTNTYSTTGGNPATAAQTTGQVGININTPAASSILDLTSTTAGLLIPRMTTSQMNAIGSPATGLKVFNTTSGTTYTYSGSAWVSEGIISGSFSGVGTATTVFTVTFGGTQPNATYKVNVTPTAALSAALFYVTNKTTTTFDVTYLAGLTGTVTFDFSLFQ